VDERRSSSFCLGRKNGIPEGCLCRNTNV
jgi:hypothetical protein